MSSAPGPSVKVHNNRTTFILGSGDAPDMYSTTARDAFARAMPPMAARDEGGALAASKQRESSIVLGTDKFEYISTFKADEKSWSAEEAVEARGKQIERDTRATSYSLGHESCDFGTTQADAFVTFTTNQEERDEERVRQAGVRSELRHTHFTLGDEIGDFTTTASAGQAAESELIRAVDPAARRLHEKEKQARKEELRNPNIVFGDAKTEYFSTAAMPAHKVEKFTMKRKYMHGTSFTLGDAEHDWQTTAYAAEGKDPRERAKLGSVDVPRRDVDWKAQLEKAMATKEI